MISAPGRTLTVLCLLMLVAACAGPRSSEPGINAVRAPAAPTAPKRIVAATIGDPPSFYRKFNSPGVRGGDALEQLVNAGLTQLDGLQRLIPQLAEDVPDLDNGLWRLSSDGRMETTWRIRADARWHDGAAVTSEDAVFTIAVWRDASLPTFRDPAYGFIESAQAIDPRTVRVTWSQPYVNADALFNAPLLPEHLLGSTYRESKDAFLDSRYWSHDFVGTGPYQVREWELGSRTLLRANPSYLLGRPNIEEIEVKFFLDSNSLIASLLAGAVDVTLGRTLTSEQGLEVREHWREGSVAARAAGWYLVHPQFRNPTPPTVLDARLRRGLLHAIDRQELADTIGGGLAPTADIVIGPDEPEYRDLEPHIVRHAYDQRRAMALLEEVGYRRGGDGVVRDSSGEPLSFDTWTTFDPLNQKILFAVTDDWRQLGIGIVTTIIPAQRVQDQELRARFPSFEVVGAPNGVQALTRVHGSQARVPEHNYTGNNNANYMNPELDALLDRFFTTIPRPERIQVGAQIVRHMTEQVVWMGLFYRMEPSMMANRMRNVTPGPQGYTQAWNAHAWDVQ
jgi:peptide/nickel transport system substrate-binding protein